MLKIDHGLEERRTSRLPVQRLRAATQGQLSAPAHVAVRKCSGRDDFNALPSRHVQQVAIAGHDQRRESPSRAAAKNMSSAGSALTGGGERCGVDHGGVDGNQGQDRCERLGTLGVLRGQFGAHPPILLEGCRATAPVSTTFTVPCAPS